MGVNSVLTIEQRGFAQVYNVREMVNSSPEDKLFEAGWKLVFENLQAIYQLAREHEIEVVLLIYPFTFQIFAEELQHPQRILLEHAGRQGVGVIDLTRDYKEAFRVDIEQVLREIGKAGELAQEDVDLLLAFQAKRYFMDEDPPHSDRQSIGRIALGRVPASQGHS